MADDELDTLYEVRPDAFTAERTKLAAAARRRGDDTAAKRISAARKPTTAAWVVNRLALRDANVRVRLADLGDRLVAAHVAMDGDLIRELSAEQHKLIGELVRAALDAADATAASTAVRDDVTGTLQAAVADPEVRERLGRLARPERWSGFGAFGAAASAATKRPATTPPQSGRPARAPDRGRKAVSDRRRDKLTAAVGAAERGVAKADNELARRQEECGAARLRRDEALAALRKAERRLADAEDDVERAKQVSDSATDLLKEAKVQLKRL